MGKSNHIIFNEYKNFLDVKFVDSISFLGFSSENDFTLSITSNKRDFYDLSLSNWEINSDWQLKQKYDLIVCTRCAYFSKDPFVFINKVKSHLNPGGKAFIDWGLGDHWRFEDYKVGWVRDGKQEYAYSKDNFLYSCMWRESFENEDEVKNFWHAVKNKHRHYAKVTTLSEVVRNEVPSIVDYDCEKLSFKFLWPDSPQLYIMTLIKA